MATRKNYLAGIKVKRLPRSFQDAIRITQALGVQYIWIDSLCIIQDSPEMVDWRKEAPRMAEVYGNSYCNIAASNARNSREGLFRRRTASGLAPSTVRLQWRGEDMECKLIREDYWLGEVLSEPLYGRAWVLQG